MFELLAGIDVSLLLFGAFALLLFIGVPIAYALGAATLIVLYTKGMPGVLMPQTAYNATNSFPLMAVPFFVLAGYLMQFGGLSRRLIAFAEVLIGNVSGGLACVTILACVFFAAISGSGPATVAAIGAIMIPAMIQRGYSPGFAGAVASTGGTIGIMIPPSTPMIFYGVAGNVSITDMFMAGILPGLLVSGALIAVSWWLSRQSGYGGTGQTLSAARFMSALKGATLALLAPVIILGGIYGGVFTPTEASVVAVAYALVVGGLVYRELTWDDIYRALLHAVVVCGTVTIIVGLAGGFGRVLTTYQIPQAVGAGLLEITDSWIVLLILIGLTLIVIGTFMETLATIIILTPILLPVVTQVGVDPVHFGILLIITSEISFLTPPLGANLFVAMRISGASLEQVTMAVLPFIVALIIMTGLLIVLPQISTFVPTLLG